MRLLSIPILLSICFGTAFGDDSDDYLLEIRLVSLINQERSAEGLDELTYSVELEDIAVFHLSNMIATETYSHIDTEERNVTGRALALHPELIGAFGENIAGVKAGVPAETAERTVALWMQSDQHSENILSEKYNRIGLGSILHEGYYYTVAVFGEIAGECFIESETYHTNDAVEIHVFTYPDFSKPEMVPYLYTPNHSAVHPAYEDYVYIGVECLRPIWTDSGFVLEFNLDDGAGEYRIKFAVDGKLYPTEYSFYAE